MTPRVTPQELLPFFVETMNDNVTAALEQLALLKNRPDDAAALHEVHRRFHSMKTSAQLMELTDLADIARSEEDVFRDCIDRNMTPSLEALTAAVTALETFTSALEHLEVSS